MALHDPQRVVGQILARDEPGLPAAVLRSSNADALALPERVKAQPHVLAQHAAVGRADRAWTGRQVAGEEGAERALADEADAGGVPLGRVGKSDPARQLAHLGLAQLAQRKERARKLRLGQAMQEIALILGAVDRAQQPVTPVSRANACVMARRDPVRTE